MKKAFKIFLTILVVFLISSCEKGKEAKSEKFAVDPYPVMKKAMEEGKFLIVIFESETCKYCERLNKEVLSDLKVKEAAIKNGVEIAIVDVNGDRTVIDPPEKKEVNEQILAYLYRITGYPTIMVFDKNKDYQVLYKIPGFIDKESFLDLLYYLGTGCYEKGIDIRKFREMGRKC